MKELRIKNDEGIVAIEILGDKFAENIETTQAVASGVAYLSQKSSSIGGIVESIRSIAQQTNTPIYPKQIGSFNSTSARWTLSVRISERLKTRRATSSSIMSMKVAVGAKHLFRSCRGLYLSAFGFSKTYRGCLFRNVRDISVRCYTKSKF